MSTKYMQTALLGLALVAVGPSGQVAAQTGGAAASAAPHQSGTVKSVADQSLVLTTATGQDVQVGVASGTTVLLVQPGSHDLKSAQKGTVADIAAGDRAIVNGTAGDTADSLHASRVIVMKSGAISASRAAEQAAWAQGVGGIVRSVDPDNGNINISSGMKSITVQTMSRTVVRRYAGGSVRFEDAVPSAVSAIHPGDQIRARGSKMPDGLSMAADEIVAGSFSNFSGIVSSVDASAGTVTLKDLASKRTVTVNVTASSNVRRMPAGTGGASAGRSPGAAAGEAPAQATPTAAAGGGGRPGGGGGGRAGGDLSRMMNRFPTETLADLKPGDAVMIVASNAGDHGEPTAITLLAGVEGILAAHPTGETTLSPWNIGGGEAEGEGGGEGASPR